MRVIYWDHTTKLPHGNARPCSSLGELLAESDIVTLHVPETPETIGMIGRAQIAAMKPGSILINNARGLLVDLDAVADALKSGICTASRPTSSPRSRPATASASKARSRACPTSS